MMLRALRKWLSPRDQETRLTDRTAEQSAKVLEMDEPMAGAGALLAGTRRKSETERELEEAAGSRR